MHGLFIGESRTCLENAVALAQKKNIQYVDHKLMKCVVYLDPQEFKTTWIGNKAIFRSRMAIADGGELLILAPGVERFGEDPEIDSIIRKYGYSGTDYIMKCLQSPECSDLQENMGAASHIIGSSSDGRFRITYAVKKISKKEITDVGFEALDYDEAIEKYDPEKLQPGFNTVLGEEIFFINNPAIGLWKAGKVTE